MATFKVEFHCDNPEFDYDTHEAIAAILQKVAVQLQFEGYYHNSSKKIVDTNGNLIGSFKFSNR